MEAKDEFKSYTVQATHRTPALVIYLLDISGSMSLEMDGQRRIDVVMNALSSAIKQMVFRSTKGSRISSRYRLAILTYSDQVYDILGGIRSIDEFAQTGTLPSLSPMKFTDTAKAFEYAEKLLEAELPHMQDCPAPLICHMTDGAHTGADPEPIVKRIMQMSVPDGNVLVENIFISDSILNQPIENVKTWKGVTADTVFNHDVANKLRNMSSVLPESYRDMMTESSYALKAGAFMLLPGTSAELVSLGFQMSAATPVMKY
ncbi:VWA domain-containing protein [Paenibacillus alginolyticus]|nr:VWA domain-containing protein [Paenibacillus alginolyticus]